MAQNLSFYLFFFLEKQIQKKIFGFWSKLTRKKGFSDLLLSGVNRISGKMLSPELHPKLVSVNPFNSQCTHSLPPENIRKL